MAVVRTYIGLGANMGAAPVTLGRAVVHLGALPGARLYAVSRLYATRPVGVIDQPDFHNAVACLDMAAAAAPATAALELLVALKGLEGAFGRQRRPRWGPRELDLDLLLFGRHRLRVERPQMARSADPERSGVQWLEVPHASAMERLFVLEPLADISPRLVPPGWHVTVATARDRRRSIEGVDAVRPVAHWGGAGWQRDGALSG